jgi:hypothetical protein
MKKEGSQIIFSSRLDNPELELEQNNLFEGGKGAEPVDFSEFSHDTIMNFLKEINKRNSTGKLLSTRLIQFQTWLQTEEGKKDLKKYFSNKN